eukprot:2302191-Amphidinium_carterae.1
MTSSATSATPTIATPTEMMGSPPPSTILSLTTMGTKEQLEVFMDELDNLWSEDELLDYLVDSSQDVNRAYELLAPILYKKILISLRVCATSLKTSVFDNEEEGRILFTHSTGKGMK